MNVKSTVKRKLRSVLGTQQLREQLDCIQSMLSNGVHTSGMPVRIEHTPSGSSGKGVKESVAALKPDSASHAPSYRGSYFEHFNFCSNCFLFADSLSRMLGKNSATSNLRLAMVGDDQSIQGITYGFSTYGYHVIGMFGGVASALHKQQPIESMRLSDVDVVFASADERVMRQLEQMMEEQGARPKVVPLSQVVKAHLVTLESVEWSGFNTCLDATRLSVLAMCIALSRGDVFVECGVYMGGGTIYVAKLAEHLGRGLQIHALDTFEGMPPPVEKDGHTPFREGLFADNHLDHVRRNYESHGVAHRITMHKGLVQDTLPRLNLTKNVALALVDTDQYTGTRASLSAIMPQLAEDGLILVDDADGAGVDAAIREAMIEHRGFRRINVALGLDILHREQASRAFSVV